MRPFVALGLFALVVFTAHAWTPFLLESPAIKAFVLSDRFWPAVFGVVAMLAFLGAASCAALVFHPGALSGRRPEGGE